MLLTDHTKATFAACGMIALWLIPTGCQHVDPHKGYSTADLYRTDVKTVFVEMFQSDSFEREIEYELTRAICEQLELCSPFKVVGNRHKADTILYGTIRNVSAAVLTQQRDLGRPLQNQVVLTAEATWKDLRTDRLLMDNRKFKINADYAVLAAAGRGSALKQAANEMALTIVQTMEKPW